MVSQTQFGCQCQDYDWTVAHIEFSVHKRDTNFLTSGDSLVNHPVKYGEKERSFWMRRKERGQKGDSSYI